MRQRWINSFQNENGKKIICLFAYNIKNKKKRMRLLWSKITMVKLQRIYYIQSHIMYSWNEDVKQYYYISLEKIRKYFKNFSSAFFSLCFWHEVATNISFRTVWRFTVRRINKICNERIGKAYYTFFFFFIAKFRPEL